MTQTKCDPVDPSQFNDVINHAKGYEEISFNEQACMWPSYHVLVSREGQSQWAKKFQFFNLQLN